MKSIEQVALAVPKLYVNDAAWPKSYLPDEFTNILKISQKERKANSGRQGLVETGRGIHRDRCVCLIRPRFHSKCEKHPVPYKLKIPARA